MSSIVDKLISKELITPPYFIRNNVHYEALTGSVAYGCSGDTSDMDIIGWCIPPKDYIFPHLKGVIPGFDKQVQAFSQYQMHHINDKSAKKNYDLQVYGIVKYFRLVADNNPNMIDSLFVPRVCVLHSTEIGEMVREKRRMFLHKGSWHKFKGYAYSQLSKCKAKSRENVKRQESIDKYGYDVKFAYHIVRLLNEVEQILIEGDLDLYRNKEQLKSIRRGEWRLEQINDYFNKKESELETAYTESKLRHSPDETAIKQLLLDCLEHHYGSLEGAIAKDEDAVIKNCLREILINTEKLIKVTRS